MDVEVAKKERAEKINKLKLLRQFAKNPTLKNTSKVLQPKEDQALLAVVLPNNDEQQLHFDRSIQFGSQDVKEVPLMEKYQITSEIEDYKKQSFKKASVSQYIRANAYKRKQASASSVPPDKDRDQQTAETELQLKKPNLSGLKNEIVGAVVANAAGVKVAQIQHQEINISERFKLELSKTQKGDRKFLPPSMFQKDFEYPVATVTKLKTKTSLKTPMSNSQTKEKEVKEKVTVDAQVTQSLLGCLETQPSSVNTYFATNNDFNFNLQQDHLEEHMSTYRAFNTYVQFCNKVYWGPNQTNVPGVQNGLVSNDGTYQSTMPSSATLPNGAKEGGGIKEDKSMASLFIQNLIQQQVKTQSQKSRFQLTAFDILFNPLRKDHPFEDWSPKEISRFQACFLIYGKAFGEFRAHLPRKNYSEIQEFYRAWKHTPFYKEWKKQNKQAKPKRNEETITEQLFL